MNMNTQGASPINRGLLGHPLVTWAGVIGLIYLLLVAVGMIGSGFKAATGGQAKELFEFATNPFIGLVIGTVATALIQSSSTVTSIIVGLVAGGLPVSTAVPMIMGANIGTTVTNTLVSLGHIRNKHEFRRAFSAATVHDFFNLLAVVIFLPLEIMFGILEKIGGWLATAMVGGASMDMKSFNFIKPLTKPVIGAVKDTFGFMSKEAAGAALIATGIVLIFVAITFMGKLLKTVMVGRARNMLQAAIGRGPVSGITSGALVTVAVQSSSTTTSLMVPLVGNGILRMRDVYPFTLGSNIGTCITALLAATAVSGEYAVYALQIALVHLAFNTLAVVAIYGTPPLRELPPRMAEWLADVATENKFVALAYLKGVFILIPLMLIFANPVLSMAVIAAFIALAVGLRKGAFKTSIDRKSEVVSESEPVYAGLSDRAQRYERIFDSLPTYYYSSDLREELLRCYIATLKELCSKVSSIEQPFCQRKLQLAGVQLKTLSSGMAVPMQPPEFSTEMLPVHNETRAARIRSGLVLLRSFVNYRSENGLIDEVRAAEFSEEMDRMQTLVTLEFLEAEAAHAMLEGEYEFATANYFEATRRVSAHAGTDFFLHRVGHYNAQIAELKELLGDRSVPTF